MTDGAIEELDVGAVEVPSHDCRCCRRGMPMDDAERGRTSTNRRSLTSPRRRRADVVATEAAGGRRSSCPASCRSSAPPGARARPTIPMADRGARSAARSRPASAMRRRTAAFSRLVRDCARLVRLDIVVGTSSVGDAPIPPSPNFARRRRTPLWACCDIVPQHAAGESSPPLRSPAPSASPARQGGPMSQVNTVRGPVDGSRPRAHPDARAHLRAEPRDREDRRASGTRRPSRPGP